MDIQGYPSINILLYTSRRPDADGTTATRLRYPEYPLPCGTYYRPQPPAGERREFGATSGIRLPVFCAEGDNSEKPITPINHSTYGKYSGVMSFLSSRGIFHLPDRVTWIAAILVWFSDASSFA